MKTMRFSLITLAFAFASAASTSACSSTSSGTHKFACGTSEASDCVRSLAGTYQGTFSGAESGAWTVVFSKSGVATGTAKVGSTSIELNGSVNADGNFVFGEVSGIEFKGSIFLDGSVSGTWSKGGYSGEFAGRRDEGSIVIVHLEERPDASTPDADKPTPVVDAGPPALAPFECIGAIADCTKAMAGNYSGSFSGDGFGTWKAAVATNGSITGSANAGEMGTLALSGKVDAKGLLVFSNPSKGAQFSGQLYIDGSVGGTWSLAMGQGKFVGTRLEGPPKP